MRSFVLSLLLLAPLAASAVPMNFTHQGRLMDAVGAPLTGSDDVTFRLYQTASGGTAVWEEVHTGVEFDNGYFSARLGDTTTLDAATFDGNELFLALQVGTGPELGERVAIVSVPYAVRAGNLVDGAILDVGEIRINGTTVIDSDGQIDGASLPGGDGDTLGDLTCGTGQVAAYDGANWACADKDGAHTHSATDIDSGVLSVDQIPVGSGSTQVAAGDHNHSLNFADIGGSADVAQLPVGTGSNNVAAGDHSHSLSFSDLGGSAVVGQLPMGGTGSADVAYADHTHDVVKPGASSATCDSGTTSLHGTLRWTGASLDVCTSNGWRVVTADAATGGSVADPAITCKTLLADWSGASSGLYWVDPDGAGGTDPFQTYCDMTTDGGGWTLAAYAHAGATSTSSANANHRSLKCGGGTWNPTSRSNSAAAVNAIALAQQSTHMAISINTNGAAQATGGLDAYQRAYKITIPDPSKVTFISHSYKSGNWGTGDNQAGACVSTTVEGIVGTTWSGTRYIVKNSLGASWGDSYPTGYGVASSTTCINPTDGGPFVTSFHSGHGGGGTYGTHIAECDVTHGSLNYTHRGNYVHDAVNTTGGNAIWFR